MNKDRDNKRNCKGNKNWNFIVLKKYFKIDSHRPSPSSIRNNSSSSSTHSLQTLPEYTATVTSNNTPILQTQTSVITTQPQSTSQNLSILETNSPTSDSCDESLTTQNNVQDTSSILNRPPIPPIPTKRILHIPDPSSVLQYINSCPQSIPTATKTPRKTSIPTLPKNGINWDDSVLIMI